MHLDTKPDALLTTGPATDTLGTFMIGSLSSAASDQAIDVAAEELCACCCRERASYRSDDV